MITVVEHVDTTTDRYAATVRQVAAPGRERDWAFHMIDAVTQPGGAHSLAAQLQAVRAVIAAAKHVIDERRQP